MGENYGYFCPECDEWSGGIFKHGDDWLRQLLEAYALTRHLLDVEISVLGQRGDAISFLEKHFAHGVEVRGEYRMEESGAITHQSKYATEHSKYKKGKR